MHKREKDKAKELLKQIESSEDRFATINDDYYDSFLDRYDIGWKIRRSLPWIIFIVLAVFFVINDPFHIKEELSTQLNNSSSLNNNSSNNFDNSTISNFVSSFFPEGKVPTWFYIALIVLPIWILWRHIRVEYL